MIRLRNIEFLASLTPPTTGGIWANQVVANGGARPSSTSINAVTAFVSGLVADGLTSKMIAVCPFAPDSLIAALTPIPALTTAGNDPWTNHNFVSGDLTANGLVGDGSSKYLDTGLAPAVIFSTNGNAGLTLYVFQNVSEAKLDFSVQNNVGADTFELYPPRSGDGGFFACWSEVASDLVTGTLPNLFNGYISGNRTSTGFAQMTRANSGTPHAVAGTNTTAVAHSHSSVTSNLFVFTGNNSGSPFNLYSSKRLSFAAVHLGLTTSDSNNFFNRIQTLRTSFGGGFV